MAGNREHLQKAIVAFDRAHEEDLQRVRVGQKEIPWSLHYHRRLSHWVRQLENDPSEALLLAARCQHIRRWSIARTSYPEGRSGYRKWRKTLAQFHAHEARRILETVGYREETIQRVEKLLLKFQLKQDPEVQLLEDAICLVFLENEFSSFSAKHEEAKLVSILRKTWKKMSAAGHAAALELVQKLPEEPRHLVEKAVSGE